ncbi:class I SAM-dependent methyltransferase [Pelagibacterales bacterium SAG-MED50]|nr:class I SAM-dependent methyltransferase [Pelagibacterales bacterium SAG-MED50]
MNKVLKFSKSYENILKIKKDFYDNNKTNLKNVIKIYNEYKKQPLRKYCKNCGSKKIKLFIKNFNIPYKLCSSCGHLNGAYEDTVFFAKKLYTENEGKNYSKNYLNDFNKRVENIYIPKVDFLKKVIKKKINLLDLGCGAGHFVKALEQKGISATGYDTSKDLCELGNKKLKKNKIYSINFEKIYEIIKNHSEFNTLSMIGVLEHLTEPHKLLNSFKKSKIKYLYISVPLFSLSSFLANSFPNVFPRQLSSGHTHLYTEKSLNYLAKKHKLKIIGEYWFGTDFPDLMRSLINTGNIINKKIYTKELYEKFSKFIDDLQFVLDKNKVCSEVHMVFENKNF